MYNFHSIYSTRYSISDTFFSIQNKRKVKLLNIEIGFFIIFLLFIYSHVQTLFGSFLHRNSFVKDDFYFLKVNICLTVMMMIIIIVIANIYQITFER
jgi:hypothetical protein